LYQRVPTAERKSPAAIFIAMTLDEARSMNSMSLELVASSRV
jgi:hypothetical protein